AGNRLTVWLVRHSQRKRGATDRLNLRSMAPVLDPTNVGIVLLVYFLAFLFFSPGLASLEHLALSARSLAPFLILAIFAVVAIGIRWYARESEIRKGPLLFADEREPIVPSMELR